WPHRAADPARPRRRGDRMSTRRKFITLLGGAAAAWPQALLAQATARRPLVAFLAWPSLQGEPISTYIRQFLKGMREFGYAEGRDFEMAYRTAEGHSDRLPRALLTHRAPTLDGDEKPLFGPRVQDAWKWQVPVSDLLLTCSRAGSTQSERNCGTCDNAG